MVGSRAYVYKSFPWGDFLLLFMGLQDSRIKEVKPILNNNDYKLQMPFTFKGCNLPVKKILL